MRFKLAVLTVLLAKTTYPLAFPPVIHAVDLWTFGGIANSLQDGSLSCICPSDYKDSKPNLWRLHYRESSNAKCKMQDVVQGMLIDGMQMLLPKEQIHTNNLQRVLFWEISTFLAVSVSLRLQPLTMP